MMKAHQMSITGILTSETLVLPTSQPVPTHGPSLEPHVEVQHLPAEVKWRVKRETTFLDPCRLSISTVWIWCKQTGSISNFLH